MKKRIWISIILAAILVLCTFALCSCGGNGGENDQTENNSPTQPSCEHQYQGVVSQEGTCETDEIITYTCALCQHTYSMTTPAMGHDLVNHSEKTPTCTQVGWDAYVTCSRCDYTTYEELPPHTMENGECVVCHTPESTPGLEYKFNFDSKSYTVTGIGTCTKSDIVIGIYNGYSVTYIDSRAFYDCYNLTSIIIPDSVTSIGEWAFYDCYNLTSIVIPDNVTSIGDEAFSDCYNLTIYCEATSKPSGWYPDWTSSDRPVVWGYNNITTNSEYDYVLHNDKAHLTKYKGDATEVIIPSSIDGYEVEFFGSIFSGNKRITSVKIPDSVTSIGSYAFYACDSLTSIVIPDSVTSIGERAFYGCDSLTSVTIGNSVTSIGEWAFAYCSSITSVTIGNSVTSIGTCAFSSCRSLTSVVIPDSVTSIGSYAFSSCKSLTSVTIGNSVTSIGDHAFAYCSSITSVTIGNSVTSIGEQAFYDCDSLKSIVIPDGVTSIGNYAFLSCDSLTSVVITDDVTSIGDGAFSGCTSLTSIVIPDSVTSIGDGTFSGCDSLTSIVIPDSVTSIGDSAFSSCTSLKIYCEATSQPSGWSSDWNRSNRPVVWGYKAD